MGQDIAFWILATLVVASALGVVWLRNIFRAALCLILCFLAIAGVYITLDADFLGAVQVLINVGAVAIMIILAIMLTREIERGSLPNRLEWVVMGAAAAFTGVAIYAVLNTPWPESGLPPAGPTTDKLADILFGQGGFILPVEIAALMLLATIIGAIVLLREK
jgi:NADH-quinone oxidoreductase subunit J